MTSDAGSQSSPPAAEPPKPGGEEGRIKSLDDRFGAIETEQKEQRGILGRIETLLTGGHSPKAGTSAASATASDAGSGLSVAEQVKRGVEEIEARKAKEAEDKAAQDADKAWRQGVDERLAERKPGEPATGRKAKLQAALFGKPDQR